MDWLIFAQTFFYFTVSFTIIVFGILSAFVIYQLIFIMKRLKNISDNLDDTTGELKEKIENILENLEKLPFFSFFFKKSGGKKKTKD